jgi:SHS2 domain-containing protein
MDKIAGYREIEHTADRELQVWGPDLVSLLKTAAEGMYFLLSTKLASSPIEVRKFEIAYVDRESLIVDFLSELLFIGEDEGIAFDDFDLRIGANTLTIMAHGSPIQKQGKEIKAVTYHGMQVIETERGLEVCIVFDV